MSLRSYPNTLTEPQIIAINTVSKNDILCFGDATGAIEINIAGGTPTEVSPGIFEYSYSWTGPNGFTSNAQNISNLFAGTYTIEITDELGCVEVPNSFTPNGDGMNDTWNLNFNGYNDVSLQVYSKWGKLVFETKSPTIQWDGQYGGDDLPSGTYYYVLKLDDSVDQNGPLTIVR